MTFPRIYKKEETDRWQREVEVCTWFHCSSAARGRPENCADQIFIILVIPIDHHCYDCSFLTRKVKVFANLEREVCCWCCYSVTVCWHDTHSSLWIGSMGSLPTSWQSWEWYFQSASSLNQKAESRRKRNNNLSDKNTPKVSPDIIMMNQGLTSCSSQNERKEVRSISTCRRKTDYSNFEKDQHSEDSDSDLIELYHDDEVDLLASSVIELDHKVEEVGFAEIWRRLLRELCASDPTPANVIFVITMVVMVMEVMVMVVLVVVLVVTMMVVNPSISNKSEGGEVNWLEQDWSGKRICNGPPRPSIIITMSMMRSQIR